jgi:hypothetical protein
MESRSRVICASSVLKPWHRPICSNAFANFEQEVEVQLVVGQGTARRLINVQYFRQRAARLVTPGLYGNAVLQVFARRNPSGLFSLDSGECFKKLRRSNSRDG